MNETLIQDLVHWNVSSITVKVYKKYHAIYMYFIHK